MAGLDDIEQRILRAAIELAETEGEVRQREVAARAGVALGTLYSRFPTKDLLLLTALELEAQRLEAGFRERPIAKRKPATRVNEFFERATASFVERPKLARAILRATVSGDPDCTAQLTGYQARLIRMAAGELRGVATDPETSDKLAGFLVMIWFAALVGWAGGATTPPLIVQLVAEAAELLIAGAGPGA